MRAECGRYHVPSLMEKRYNVQTAHLGFINVLVRSRNDACEFQSAP